MVTQGKQALEDVLDLSNGPHHRFESCPDCNKLKNMKPQMNNSGKGAWSLFWGDKVKKKFKRIFSKSDRQKTKNHIKKEVQNINE
jgi:hypothetical protein